MVIKFGFGLLRMALHVQTGSRDAPLQWPRAKHNDPRSTAMALGRQQEACVCNCV